MYVLVGAVAAVLGAASLGVLRLQQRSASRRKQEALEQLRTLQTLQGMAVSSYPGTLAFYKVVTAPSVITARTKAEPATSVAVVGIGTEPVITKITGPKVIAAFKH